ncbi:MAG: alkaline phosphatase D family protein [Flavobacteriales bacterium]|nr:alkaline phosphatase D family protein [Flavobacteriales bacterium]
MICRCGALLLVIALPLTGIAQDSVLHHWSGALSPTHIRVNAMLSGACDSVRLVVDEDAQWGSPLYSAYLSADTAFNRMVPLWTSGLEPNTAYTYRFEVSGAMDTSAANTGHFSTPGEGPYSFQFVTGSCNTTGDHPVWSSMQALHPLFFLSTGDLHYGDPTSASVYEHRDAYVHLVYEKAPMRDFLRGAPIAHVWDDHDFCGNGSYGNAIGRSVAAQAFREHVPHYGLVDDTAVYQAFTIGRVRFILTDLRSEKDSSSMMSDAQRAWLHAQLLQARDSGLVTCWATPLSWNSSGYPENWGSQPAERTALSDWLLANHIDDLFMVSGDAHMLAIDDGANGDFSSGHNSPYRYPILQAAAINRIGSYKGGSYNQGGYFPNPTAGYGQFGQVIVDDDGTDVCVTFNGWRTDSMDTALTLINSYTFCRAPQNVDTFGTKPLAAAFDAWYADGALIIHGVPTGPQVDARIIDATGREVLAISTRSADEPIPISDLRAGTYVAIVRQEDKRAIVRFVID